MARTHARILTSIWSDGSDFLDRSLDEQWTFFALLSQRDLTTCGVLHHQPKRLARLAPGMTPARIRKAISGLSAAGYIILDPDTDELCFRTFLRNDGILRSPNLLKGAARSFDRIYSPIIRHAVLDQLPAPIRSLWPEAILTTDPKTISAILSDNPSPNPSDEGSPNPPEKDRSTSLIPDPYPLIPSPSPEPSRQGSRRNGSPDPGMAAAAATPQSGTADAERGSPPPADLVERFRRPKPEADGLGPDGWGDPELTGPDETPDDRNRRRSLALRWQDVLGTPDLVACNHAIVQALHHADPRIIDEQIGWLAQAESPPRTPTVLVTAVRRIVR